MRRRHAGAFLVELGGQERGWPGNSCANDAPIRLRQCPDLHLGVVDDRCLQADGSAHRMLVVGWLVGRATASPTGNRLRNHQIHRYALRVDLRTWLSRNVVRREVGSPHGFLDERVRAEQPRIERQIIVLGGFGKRHFCRTGVEVNRLGSDHHDGFTVLFERVQGIQKS